MELGRRRGGLRILMRLCEEVVILVGWIGGFPMNACYDTTRFSLTLGLQISFQLDELTIARELFITASNVSDTMNTCITDCTQTPMLDHPPSRYSQPPPPSASPYSHSSTGTPTTCLIHTPKPATRCQH